MLKIHSIQKMIQFYLEVKHLQFKLELWKKEKEKLLSELYVLVKHTEEMIAEMRVCQEAVKRVLLQEGKGGSYEE